MSVILLNPILDTFVISLYGKGHVLHEKNALKFLCIAGTAIVRHSILVVKRAESSQSIHFVCSHF